MGLLGTSPLKPSEVALLDVASVDELIGSTPEQWQTLQRSSRAQVHLLTCGHMLYEDHHLGIKACAILACQCATARPAQ